MEALGTPPEEEEKERIEGTGEVGWRINEGEWGGALGESGGERGEGE